jgi:hypothetical protein
MNAVDYILAGLEAELELERELGTRQVEFDRSLLVPPSTAAVARPKEQPAPQPVSPPPVSPPRTAPETSQKRYDFVFLHHCKLSPNGSEMLGKIITAMGATSESAPVITDLPMPSAKIYVVLGGNALKKFYPGKRGAAGQWIVDESGRDVLVTYSPEYILRFGTVTPAVAQIKKDMWLSLKTVVQRIKQ